MLEEAILVPGTVQQELHINDFLAASLLCFPSPIVVDTCTVVWVSATIISKLSLTGLRLLSHAVDIVCFFHGQQFANFHATKRLSTPIRKSFRLYITKKRSCT